MGQIGWFDLIDNDRQAAYGLLSRMIAVTCRSSAANDFLYRPGVTAFAYGMSFRVAGGE